MIEDPSDQPASPDAEGMFRRGYLNGASEVIYLLSHKLSVDELAIVRAWVEQELWPWARSDLDTTKRPPAFPTLDGQPPRTLGMWFPDGP